MNWKKYTDHIYCIHANDNNEANLSELKNVGILDSDIFSFWYYTIDKKFNSYKYFKDAAIIDVIKDAAVNNYNSIIIIRDDVKFIDNIEKELKRTDDYIYTVLNKDDICEDVMLIRKPMIDYIFSLSLNTPKMELYFDEDDSDIISNYYSVTKWNDIITNKIKNNFKINKISICKHKIDFVFSYVNSDDKEWQELYKKQKNTNESFNALNRWKDWGTFEYNIKLLNKYLTWINSIIIIVSSKSQIPEWVSKYNNIKIILHNEYIPEKALPTFNSCTIETYLFNIPNLSEYFIYANDDMFCINKMVPTDFFDNGKSKTNIVNLGEITTNHLQICKNSFKLVIDDFSNEYFSEIKLDKHYKRFTHIPHPMFKTTGIHIYSVLKKQIDKSISKFRSNDNINQYVFLNYDYMQQNCILHKLSATYCELDNIDKIRKTLLSTEVKMTCINDTKINYVNSELLQNEIKQIFEDKLQC